MSTRFQTLSPLGILGITLCAEGLQEIELFYETDSCLNTAAVPESEVGRQLGAYFQDGGFRFSLPLSLSGTEFQQRVWRALCRIGPGEVRTYGEIARDLGTSPRAVGNACRRNPVPIVVPCHRVVAATGIGGYSGDTDGRKLDMKRWLLTHEGVRS
jgi:methylated-DNA-[protein]-cysteine S-methyltransferase